MENIYRAFEKLFSPFITGNYWKFKVVVVATLYCILTSMPKYQDLFESSLSQQTYYIKYLENFEALNDQIENPFEPNKFHISSHSSKLSFRFVPALLVKALPIHDLYSRMLALYILNNLAGIICFLCLMTITYRYSKNRLFSALVALNFAVLYFGKSFFHDTSLWNDGIAFAFLLLSITTRNRLLTFLFLLAAFFTDERALFGGVLVYVYFKLTDKDTNYPHRFPFISISVNDLPYILSFVGYGIIRLSLKDFFRMETPIGWDSGVALFLRLRKGYPLKLNFLAIITLYKFAWIPILWSMWALRTKKIVLMMALSSLLALIVISLSVEDITRTIIYSFMTLVTAFYIFHENPTLLKIKEPAYGAFILLFANFCFPTVAVVSNFIDVIPYFTKFVSAFSIWII